MRTLTRWMCRLHGLAAAFALFATLGCAGQASSTADAGAADAGAPDASADRPAKTTSWNCANGWGARKQLVATVDEFTACEPPSPPASCPRGTMPALAEASCVPIGDPCPSGDWPAALPATNVLYVKAGGTGDGMSASRPLGTVQAAVDRATEGATIAIARGEYPEPVRVASGITILGACSAAVTLGRADGTFTEGPGVLVDSAAPVTLANLGIRGFRQMGFASSTISRVTLRGVDLAENEDGAISSGGWLTLERTYVHDTRAGGATDSGPLIINFARRGTGLGFEGESLTIRGSSFDRNAGHGLLVTANTIEVKDALVRGHEGSPFRESSFGAMIVPKRTVSFERVLFEKNRTIALLIFGGGLASRTSFKDFVVRDTEVDRWKSVGGFGLVVVSGGTVSLENALFLRNRSVAVATEQPSLDLSFTNVVIDGTQGVEADPASRDAALAGGLGISITKGVHAVAKNLVVERSETAGIAVQGADARLTGTDVVVASTAANRGTGELGVGIAASQGAKLNVQAAKVTQGTAAGVMVSLASSATLRWLSVEGTRPGSLPAGQQGDAGAEGGPSGSSDAGALTGVADGVLVVGNSTANLAQVRAAACARAGVLYSGSTGSLATTTATQNRFGLVVQGERAPTADLASCSFAGNSEEAIVSSGALLVGDAPVPVPSSAAAMK